MLMTENAFLPVFLVATFAIASSLENPTTLRQVFAVAAIAVSLGVRAQAVALVFVLPGAILLYALLDRSGSTGPWDRSDPHLAPGGILEPEHHVGNERR
jgi:hypothetical protein